MRWLFLSVGLIALSACTPGLKPPAEHIKAAEAWGKPLGYTGAACDALGHCTVVDVDRYPVHIICGEHGCRSR